MENNTKPIFTGIPDFQWGGAVVSAANTAKDGTGTVTTIFTADADNGGIVDEIVFCAAGTNIASVARVFVNNGGVNSTPGNNILVREVTLPATTLSEVQAQAPVIIPFGKPLPAGYKLNVVLGTAVSAGYYVSAPGGSYKQSS